VTEKVGLKDEKHTLLSVMFIAYKLQNECQILEYLLKINFAEKWMKFIGECFLWLKLY